MQKDRIKNVITKINYPELNNVGAFILEGRTHEKKSPWDEIKWGDLLIHGRNIFKKGI